MALTIPDDVLKAAGMNEGEALVEIACRLFEAEKLSLWAGAKLAGLSRTEFEQELLTRKIPLYRPTTDDLKTDLETLDRLDR
jgi:predicted HTH domain antitoxin